MAQRSSQVPRPEIIQVDDDADQVSCDGGGGALGHPKVWYAFDGADSVECGYCDRLFTKGRGK
ncbi:MAG: zinc-finger domain-containing protein [Alphaproteobacteria bacterium PRO2]|nr:zinc-finger domain-containing protein [Alphaproteobacteria bacterium PRO2]